MMKRKQYRGRYGYTGWSWRARRRQGLRGMTPRQYSAMMKKLSRINAWEKARFDLEALRLQEQSRANFEGSWRRRW